MSLINKMLQDLESRKNTTADAASKKSVFEDLKPVKVSRYRAPSRGRLTTFLLLIVAIGAGTYAWTQWSDQLLASLFPDKPVTKSQPIAMNRPAPKPAPAPQPVSQAPLAVTAPTPAVPATSAPPKAEPPVTSAPVAKASQTAVDRDQTKTAVTPPAASADSAATVMNKAPVVANNGYWTVSRGDTLFGISTKTGIDLGSLSNWNQLGSDHVIRPGQRLRLTPPGTTEIKSAKPATKITKQEPKKEKVVVATVGKPRAQDVVAKAAPAKPPIESVAKNGAMDKRTKPFSADDQAESEYRLAANLLQQGRAAEAERRLKAALGISAEHTKARELLAGLYLQNGRSREAQQMLEAGIEKVPAYYPFAQLLARVYVEHGADQKALGVMENSRQAGAGNADFMGFLAALYQRAGKHPEAINAYTEALKLNPQEGRSWLGLGISLENAHERNAAGDAYQRAIEAGTLDDNLLKYTRGRLAAIKN